MLVCATVNIRYRRVSAKDIKKFVADIACCRPNDRHSAKHASDEIEDVWNSAERIVIVLARCFLQYFHPGTNLIKIGME